LPAYRIFVEFLKSSTCLENTIAKKRKKGIRGVTLCSLEISDDSGKRRPSGVCKTRGGY
jgi:hypothetical protein